MGWWTQTFWIFESFLCVLESDYGENFAPYTRNFGMLYPNTNIIKRDSICHTFKKWRTPLFGIKNEEHHENVAKIPLDFGYTSKKEKNTILLGLKIKKSNKKMAKTIGFWVYLQKKKDTIIWY